MEMNEEKMEDFLIEEERHRKLISVMKEILTKIPKAEIDLSSIDNLEKSFSDFVSLQKTNSTKENNVDETSSVSVAIEQLSENLVKHIDEMKSLVIQSNKPKEYEFEVQRAFGTDKIEKVIVTTINK